MNLAWESALVELCGVFETQKSTSAEEGPVGVEVLNLISSLELTACYELLKHCRQPIGCM